MCLHQYHSPSLYSHNNNYNKILIIVSTESTACALVIHFCSKNNLLITVHALRLIYWMSRAVWALMVLYTIGYAYKVENNSREHRYDDATEMATLYILQRGVDITDFSLPIIVRDVFKNNGDVV